MQNNQVNPPWARSTSSQQLSQGAQLLGSNSMGVLAQLQQTQQMYQQKLMQPRSNLSPFGVSPMIQQTRVMQGPAFQQAAIVAYPTPRVLTPNAFQRNQNQSNSQFTALQTRVFTGKVTKLRKDFGFIDDEVFFQVSCINGKMPSIGERVLVEAVCNPNMPFKWNATKLQLVPDSSSRNHHDQYGSGGYSDVPIPMEEDNDVNDRNNQYRRSFPNKGPRFRDRDELINDRKRDYGNRGRSPIPGGNRGRSPIPGANRGRSPIPGANRGRSPAINRGRSPTVNRARSPISVGGSDRKREQDTPREKKGDFEHHSRSPLRRSSQPRRTARSLSRERRRNRQHVRYAVRVPSITLDIKETDVLVLRKRYANMYIPSDFFHAQLRWVDVFPPEEPFSLDKSCSFRIMRKNIVSPFVNDAILEPPDADYTFCAKVMLLSLPCLNEVYQKCCGFANPDAKENSFIHPTRLINFLIGIRGKSETMAIGGPWSASLDGPNPDKDPSVLIKTAIRTCKALTGIDLSICTQWFRFVELHYRRQSSAASTSIAAAGGAAETVVIFVPNVWSCTPAESEWEAIQRKYAHVKVMSKESAEKEPMEKEPSPETNIQVTELKHYSKLNPKSMSVQELRNQLQARKVNLKGLKHQLVARLTKCLKQEEQFEKTGDGSLDVEDADDSSAVITIDEENDEGNQEEDFNADKYKDNGKFTKVTLPSKPHLIVHPSRTARSGKFQCALMTLSVLLDYRPEDSKEHSFEVSLFAELFNEMLMRDFGVNIYKSLLQAHDKSQVDGGDKKDEYKPQQEDDNKKNDTTSDKKKDKTDEDIDKKDVKDKRDKREDERSKISNKSDVVKILDETDLVALDKCDPYLLLSYQYFDITHCWRIRENDLEKLLLSLGLRLSRAHVKKTIAKVLTGNMGNDNCYFFYRQLILKPNEKVTDKAVNKIEVNVCDLGNKILLPVFKTEEQNNDDSIHEPPLKRFKIQETEDTGFKQGDSPNLESLTERLKQSEQARHEINVQMNELKNENKGLYEKQHNSSCGMKNLSTDLDDSKKLITDLRIHLARATERSKLLQNAVEGIHKICSTVVTLNTTNIAVEEENSNAGNRAIWTVTAALHPPPVVKNDG